MVHRSRPGRLWRTWSGVPVIAAVVLAGSAANGDPVPAAATTTGAGAPHVSAEPPPAPPLPLPIPIPGQSLRDRAEQAKQRLDDRHLAVPDTVAAWGVDEQAGKLTIDVVGRDTTAATAFLVLAGADPTTVLMRTGAAPNRPFTDLTGGNKITNGGARCSLGVTARDSAKRLFVLTAGHCTKALPGNWVAVDGRTIGPALGKNFPGDDFGSIPVPNANFTATGKVAGDRGGIAIKGSNVASVGSKVCRSGSTTGYRCGVIQAVNQSVNFGTRGVVMGLTKTNACAQPGDSGGPFITPAGQAQGLTSGGSGNCATGGTTYFQPLKEALQVYRLTLVTS